MSNDESLLAQPKLSEQIKFQPDNDKVLFIRFVQFMYCICRLGKNLIVIF